ncbi:hypothetical protein [Taibaiella sp. KBW10]|uniref:hypothetical protein n=1 Tax=Taibaiella sp. KBW10 TaxID=2153357 RepID=UPI000F59AB9F|nr:hypothetical protein [Taibaiella sp. KBW10]
MKNVFLYFLFLLIACNHKEGHATRQKGASAALPASSKEGLPLPDDTSYTTYTTFKQAVQADKNKLKENTPDSISNYLYTRLNKDIYAYWKGTPWDFNGTSRQPGVGTIACGYFVTNTLSDLGFNIQRIKLAQVVSSEMIKTLCVGIRRFAQFDQLRTYLAQQPDNSVYIIGLDFHTGYILKDASGSYFMHANYIGRVGVVKERIEDAKALRDNKSFMIGSLTANTARLQQWVRE